MKKLLQKILNIFGYFRIEQLKSGTGVCGLCRKSIPNLIYIDDPSDNWADVGICDECIKEDEKRR